MSALCSIGPKRESKVRDKSLVEQRGKLLCRLHAYLLILDPPSFNRTSRRIYVNGVCETPRLIIVYMQGKLGSEVLLVKSLL